MMLRYHFQSDKGAAAVEFALILPVLVLVFVAMSNIGYMHYKRMIVQEAVREAAMLSSLGLGGASIKLLIEKNYASKLENVGDFFTLTATCENGLRRHNLSLTVTEKPIINWLFFSDEKIFTAAAEYYTSCD